MTRFWAVMLDETGCEFGAGVEAANKADAYDELREMYPESRCIQLESPADTAEREMRMYQRIQAEMCDPYYDYRFEDD